MPYPKGARPRHPQNFLETVFLFPYNLTWSDQIQHVTHGNGRVCKGSATPPSQRGGGLSVPETFGTPMCVHKIWETITKFWMVIKLDERKVFPCCGQKFLWNKCWHAVCLQWLTFLLTNVCVLNGKYHNIWCVANTWTVWPVMHPSQTTNHS